MRKNCPWMYLLSEKFEQGCVHGNMNSNNTLLENNILYKINIQSRQKGH